MILHDTSIKAMLHKFISFNTNSLAHLAASIGLLEALLLLAQYGADFELQTPNGIKPIHDAAANGQAGIYFL